MPLFLCAWFVFFFKFLRQKSHFQTAPPTFFFVNGGDFFSGPQRLAEVFSLSMLSLLFPIRFRFCVFFPPPLCLRVPCDRFFHSCEIPWRPSQEVEDQGISGRWLIGWSVIFENAAISPRFLYVRSPKGPFSTSIGRSNLESFKSIRPQGRSSLQQPSNKICLSRASICCLLLFLLRTRDIRRGMPDQEFLPDA